MNVQDTDPGGMPYQWEDKALPQQRSTAVAPTVEVCLGWMSATLNLMLRSESGNWQVVTGHLHIGCFAQSDLEEFQLCSDVASLLSGTAGRCCLPSNLSSLLRSVYRSTRDDICGRWRKIKISLNKFNFYYIAGTIQASWDCRAAECDA